MIRKHSPRIATMDLGTIDQAYGPFADLYGDVLQISMAASPEQIRVACLDRRSELHRALSRLNARPHDEQTLQERMVTHGKIESVAIAARILGDPDHRLAYDVNRQGRLLNRRRSKHGHLPDYQPQVRGLDAGIDAEEEGDQFEGQLRRTIPRQPNRRGYDKENTPNSATMLPIPSPARIVSEKTSWMEQETRQVDESARQVVGDASHHSRAEEDAKKKSYISSLSHIIGRLADEIADACEDTLLSVDQVFNAFTLTGKDIKAVTRRIDRAKRELGSW